MASKISASPPTASQARSQCQNFVDPVVPQTPSPKCSNGKDTQSPAPSRNSIGLRSTCSELAKKLGQSRSRASSSKTIRLSQLSETTSGTRTREPFRKRSFPQYLPSTVLATRRDCE